MICFEDPLSWSHDHTTPPPIPASPCGERHMTLSDRRRLTRWQQPGKSCQGGVISQVANTSCPYLVPQL